MLIETNREARAAQLAGTRMLILENCFDALVDALIDSGAIPHNAAAAMLDHLAERFIAHSAGHIDSTWAIDKDELFDQAVRLKIRSKRILPAGQSAEAARP